jgi:hypothetical protein
MAKNTYSPSPKTKQPAADHTMNERPSTSSQSPDLPQQALSQPDQLLPQQVLALQRMTGNQAVLRLTQNAAPTIQRAFKPGTVNGKAHLRPGIGQPDVDQYIEPALKTGAEIVFDPNQTHTQKRKILKNVAWFRAVNVTGLNWDPNTSPNQPGWIRGSKVDEIPNGEDVYGVQTPGGPLPGKRYFGENIGGYIVLKKSKTQPASNIVKKGDIFKRFTAPDQFDDLDGVETDQIAPKKRSQDALVRFKQIVSDAATHAAIPIDPTVINLPKDPSEVIKPLRAETNVDNQHQLDQWNSWTVQVWQKITQSAAETMSDINHWQSQLYPDAPAACRVTKIDIKASDLHERGLGAVFVSFNKPKGGTGLAEWRNETSFTAVLKPENRDIEKALFGTQVGSLANQINGLANLDQSSEISKIVMETAQDHGSLIQFIKGNLAYSDEIKKDKMNKKGTQALTEGIAFAFLAGMSDVHGENVMWVGDKPYFIDADNSLNKEKLQKPSSQTGFSTKDDFLTKDVVGKLDNDPKNSHSQIMTALLANSVPFFNALRATFSGKTGRIVPLYTNIWANQFKDLYYMFNNDGIVADMFNPKGKAQPTRWGQANYLASILLRGEKGKGPGLIGEAGTGQNKADNDFQMDLEASLIKADLDRGQIPFYTYDYQNGTINHNGQPIWTGQNIEDAIGILTAYVTKHNQVI